MPRPLKKRSASEIINIIGGVRKRNNKLWMNLLALAVASKPRKAKKVLRQITENDKVITQWMSRL